MPEEDPGDQREAARGADPVGAGVAGDQRADRERERHREAHVARVEHRRVDHHRRVAEQRVEAGALGRRRRQRVERVLPAHHQEQEEAGDHAEDGGGVRRDVAQRAAGQEQHRRGEQRQERGPQKQRPVLGRPQRGDLVEGRRVGRGALGHEREREVRAQEGRLEHRERGHAEARDAVDGAPAGGDPLAPSRCARRRATPRPRRRPSAARRPGRQTPRPPCQLDFWSFVNFDGHLVTSESRSATKVPCSSSPETITSRPSRNGSGTTPV